MKTELGRAQLLLTVIILFSSALYAQDTLSTEKSLEYSTVGFQISQVSGTGISYGRNKENEFRFRITGGILTTGDNSYYSIGTDYGIELTKHRPYRVFIGPALGIWGISGEPAHFNIALGTGIETPIMRESTIIENVTSGIEIYYPTFFLLSSTIGIAGGAFISFNF